MDVFPEAADVARRAGIPPGLARREAAFGRIEVGAATTQRAGRLFRREAVREYIERRLQCRARSVLGNLVR
jgi:hypothetical protein